MGQIARRKRKERMEEIVTPLPHSIQETAISKDAADALGFKGDFDLVQGQAGGEEGGAAERQVRAYQRYHLPSGTVCAKHRDSYVYERQYKNGPVQQFPEKGGVHLMFPSDIIIMTPPDGVLPTPLDGVRALKKSEEEQLTHSRALLVKKMRVRVAQVAFVLFVHKNNELALNDLRAPWDEPPGSDDENAAEGGGVGRKFALVNESLEKLFGVGFTEAEVCDQCLACKSACLLPVLQERRLNENLIQVYWHTHPIDRVCVQARAQVLPLKDITEDVYEYYRETKDGGLHSFYRVNSDALCFLCRSGRLLFSELKASLKLPHIDIWDCKKGGAYTKEGWKQYSEWIKGVALVILSGPYQKNPDGLWHEMTDLDKLLDFTVEPEPGKKAKRGAVGNTMRYVRGHIAPFGSACLLLLLLQVLG